ncbi:CidA/LrgA family protein [Burkholderia sp. Ax-1719]|uniref:CidA/LrgA family protein n=1 Tax=Burkholderia sp. Ax-1719 TaxID=2608334 RepID=UPI00141E9FC7|nr:CidA/LrgA family protein [Burkholderia sp. Ax-1719]NIE66928.1 CidA/LrgA family protein [Burkholderia sp. Ax-1719]
MNSVRTSNGFSAIVPPRHLVQATTLTAVFLLLSLLMQKTHMPFNPALTGFAVLFIALLLRFIPLSAVEGGAKLLIAQSALFLIPAVVAVARQKDVLKADWAPLLLILVGGTVLSGAATAVAVELVARRFGRESQA